MQPIYVVTFSPLPLSERNADSLARNKADRESPIFAALVNAPDADRALIEFVKDDAQRASKTGIISVVHDWEEWKHGN
jgi:hypothetical protein